MPRRLPLTHLLRRLGSDTRGAFAAWAAIAFPFMSVGAAISVDVARLQSLDSDLQAAADALSRAGAAELDQTPDSMMRAEAAINNLLNNDVRITADHNVTVEKINFLRSLPTPRYNDDTGSVQTGIATEARYVEVRLQPKSAGTLFPVSLSGKFTSASLRARAIAGMEGGVCGSAPVFICNPFERDKTTTIQEAATDASFQRRQINFIQGGGKNSQYAPGNFGWLDPYGDNSGASRLREAFAVDVSDACVSQSEGVYLRPGKIASMSQAVNTRFDIYEGSFSKMSTDPRYAPAANVVKGWSSKKGNVCNQSEDSDALALPRDASYDKKLGDNDRIGNGDWDFTAYMEVNHPGFRRITIDGVTYQYNQPAKKFLPKTPPSRYAMYRWEIDNNCVPGSQTYGKKAVTPEEGLPQCHSHGPSQTVEDRRIIQVAVLNCEAIADSGVKFNGRTGPLPVEAFVRVFLTEPMGKGQDDVLRGEIVGLVDPRTDSVARDRVALVQ